jgi:hypothetical protein
MLIKKLNLKKLMLTVVVFMAGILSLSSAHGFPTAQILGVTQGNYPKAMHHGVQVRIHPIDDPNLTGFYIQASDDQGRTWEDYDNQVRPIDGSLINLPYRGRSFTFKTGTTYSIRICALYGNAQNCPATDPSRWSSAAVSLSAVSGGGSDDDQDYLTDTEEYNLGIDPLNPDSDGDGVADHIEIAHHTDPLVQQLPFLQVESDRLDFGTGNPWGENDSQHQELIVRNTGQRALRIFNLIVDDNPPGSFQVNNRIYDLTEIPAGGSIDIPIDFLPKQLGAAHGSLFLLTDDEAHFPKEISLAGTGVEIANLAVADSSPLDFGTVTVGEKTEARFVSLTNPSSDVSLKLSAFAVETLDFIVYPNQLVIPPNGTAQVRVIFSPEWAGIHSGYLRIQGENDLKRQVYKIPLRGEGDGDKSAIRLVRQNVAFGAVGVGSEKQETIRVYNDGDGILFVRWIDQGSDERASPPFRISSRSFTVPPHGSRPFAVTFRPTASGNFSSQVCLISNDTAVSGSQGKCDTLRSTSTGDAIDGGTLRVTLQGSGQ